MTIILYILQIIFVPAVSPMIIGVVRKAKARLQNRKGASIFQPYRDLWKLFHKDEVISDSASWIFKISPYIVFGTTLVLALGIPLIAAKSMFYPLGDFLVFVYLIALGTFFLALAGLDTGSAFGGIGSSREMTMAALAEGGLVFSIFSIALIAGSSNFNDMIFGVINIPPASLAVVALSFIGFFIVFLSETSRYPFDNPATHLELTMIHEAMILEYSGKRLALMEWAAANKFLIFIALGANLFFPWGMAGNISILTIASALSILVAKILILAGAVALIEGSIPKLRFFRLPDLLFTSFVLGIIAVVMSFI